MTFKAWFTILFFTASMISACGPDKVSKTPPPPQTQSAEKKNSDKQDVLKKAAVKKDQKKDPEPKNKPLKNHIKTFSLVRGMKEISGLAVASENSVFAHGDEDAIIYEIDLTDGKVIRAFALGKPTLSGDYEGIAAYDDHIYIITSNGFLYESEYGEHQARVKFNAYDTGVGEFCEVEGLSLAPFEGRIPEFIILCKEAKVDAYKDKITLFRWSLQNRKPLTEPWLSIECKTVLTDEKDCKKFLPSGVAWKPDEHLLFIISAVGHRIIEMSDTGELVTEGRLKKKYHPQAEGITIMPDGRVIISDEAEGAGSGRLAIFKPEYQATLSIE